jgi:hypothetical protein
MAAHTTSNLLDVFRRREKKNRKKKEERDRDFLKNEGSI